MSRRFLPFHRPEIGKEEMRAALATLRSRWLTTGPQAKHFEGEFAQYVGARHGIAVSSCTAALHLGLEAVGISEGDEVLVPTMTFSATASVVLHLKAKPVLVDCLADTLNIDPDQLERKITSRTKAIIPVHIAGHPCAMGDVMAFARARGLKVVEDAAHALPARYRGQLVGGIGDVTCFSFYATKTITTGEGGMATTDDDTYAERMRVMSLHGITKDAWKRYTAEGSWFYEVVAPGYKYNMADLEAAIGIEQLKKSDRFWKARDRIAAMYASGLAGVPEIELPETQPDVQHAWHLYIVKLALERLRITRNEFIERLRGAGIGTSVHFIPLHMHPYYRDVLGYKRDDFPVAMSAFERIVSLPIYPSMNDQDVERVIVAVRRICKGYCR